MNTAIAGATALGQAQALANGYKLAIAKEWALDQLDTYCATLDAEYVPSDSAKAKINELTVEDTSVATVQAKLEAAKAVAYNEFANEELPGQKEDALATIDGLVPQVELTDAGAEYLATAKSNALDDINNAQNKEEIEVAVAAYEEALDLVQTSFNVTIGNEVVSALYGTKMTDVAAQVQASYSVENTGYTNPSSPSETQRSQTLTYDAWNVGANAVVTSDALVGTKAVSITSAAPAQSNGSTNRTPGYTKLGISTENLYLNETVINGKSYGPTVMNASTGIVTTEGHFWAWGSRTENYRGGGFTIYQASTGKSVTLVQNGIGYSDTENYLRIVINNGDLTNESPCIVIYPKSGAAHNVTNNTPDNYYQKIEIDGYNIKMWVSNNATYDANELVFEFNLYDVLSNPVPGENVLKSNGIRNGYTWDSMKAYFPYYAENDGNSDIVMGFSALYASTAGETQVTDAYTSYNSFESIIKDGWDDENKDSYNYFEAVKDYAANRDLAKARGIAGSSILSLQDKKIVNEYKVTAIEQINAITLDEVSEYFDEQKALAVSNVQSACGATADSVIALINAQIAEVEELAGKMNSTYTVTLTGGVNATYSNVKYGTKLSDVVTRSSLHTTSSSAQENGFDVLGQHTLNYVTWDADENAAITGDLTINTTVKTTTSKNAIGLRLADASAGRGTGESIRTGGITQVGVSTESLYLIEQTIQCGTNAGATYPAIVDASQGVFSATGRFRAWGTIKDNYRGGGFTIYQPSTGKSVTLVQNSLGYNDGYNYLRLVVNDGSGLTNSSPCVVLQQNKSKTTKVYSISAVDYYQKIEIDGYNIKFYVNNVASYDSSVLMFEFNLLDVLSDPTTYTSDIRNSYSWSNAQANFPYYADGDIAIGVAALYASSAGESQVTDITTSYVKK